MKESMHAIPMKESDRDWVRHYLSQDAATNNPGLQDCTHWVVWEWWRDGKPTAEVLVSVGEDRPISREGFFRHETNYEQWIEILNTTGFPIDDYDFC